MCLVLWLHAGAELLIDFVKGSISSITDRSDCLFFKVNVLKTTGKLSGLRVCRPSCLKMERYYFYVAFLFILQVNLLKLVLERSAANGVSIFSSMLQQRTIFPRRHARVCEVVFGLRGKLAADVSCGLACRNITWFTSRFSLLIVSLVTDQSGSGEAKTIWTTDGEIWRDSGHISTLTYLKPVSFSKTTANVSI